MDDLNQLQEKYKNTHDISQKLQILQQLFKENKDNKELNNYKKKFNQLRKEFNSHSKKNKGYLSNFNSQLNDFFKSLPFYSMFTLSALNMLNAVGAKTIRSTQNIKNIDGLPEIDVFIRKNNGEISLTALNDDKLDHRIDGIVLRDVFTALGSKYITDSSSFNTNGGYSGSVKVDSSSHSGILSIVLIFPQKIAYNNNASPTQIIQFLGKIENGVFRPYNYELSNSVVCKGNEASSNVDRCFVDNLNVPLFDSISDYQHQVVHQGNLISISKLFRLKKV